MKAIICSAFAFAYCNSTAKVPSDLQLLFLKNHISAGFETPFLITQHKEHKGLGDLSVRTLPGFAFKVEYSYNFNSYIGLTSGAKMGVQVFGFHAGADAKDFDLLNDLSRKYFQMIPFLNLPIMFTPRILISKKNILQADLGASATFFVPGNSLNTLNFKNGVDVEEVFVMKTYFADSPQFTFHTGLSYGVMLKNQNILKAGLAYNFGWKTVIDGHYSFHKDDVIVGYGNIASSFNHFALEVSYVFTRSSFASKN